jgi:hypothetical protein
MQERGMAWKAWWPVSLTALAVCAGIGLDADAEAARAATPASVHVRDVSFSNDARQLRGVLSSPTVLARLSWLVLLGVAVLATRRRSRSLRVGSALVVGLVAALVVRHVSRQARAAAVLHVLSTDHLSDHLAAFEWLHQQPFVTSVSLARWRARSRRSSFSRPRTITAWPRVKPWRPRRVQEARPRS